jgi:arginine/serine-rich splicing factor 4/5/6
MVDLKSNFAFVYYRDNRDGDDAIKELDRRDFGRDRLRVEWARGDGIVRRYV